MSRKKANKADLAKRAIKYLDQNALVFQWDFPQVAPPSDEIRDLLKSYFSNGEIEWTTAGHLRNYLIDRLEEDFLFEADARGQSGQDHAPWSGPPVFRIVCCDGDDD